MKSMKLFGLSLLALLALGALVASSASAVEGFLVGGTATPTTANVLGGESILETSAKIPIKCATLDDSTITFESDHHAKGTLHWLGCKSLGQAAKTKPDTGEEILVPVLFLVCLDPLNAKKELVALYGVIGETTETATIEIPTLGAKIEVKGAVAGAILTSGSTKLFVVDFTGKEGKQTVTDCKQIPTGTLVEPLLLSNKNGGAFEASSENVTAGLIQFPANTELMAT
jgi:hypothetical protein